MTVTDYLEQFERIEICHVFNSEVQDGAEVARFGDYIVHCKGGQWLEGSTTGGPFLISKLAEQNENYLAEFCRRRLISIHHQIMTSIHNMKRIRNTSLILMEQRKKWF